jgi:hypothetical protein
MNVTKDGFKNRQLHIEDYLQIVSAEQRGYAEVFDHQRITENNDIITGFWTNNLLELILRGENINKAYLKVKSNMGAGGINGMQADELLPFLRENQSTLIEQAIAQELTPIFEEQFSKNSYDLRPNRGQHDVLKACQRNMEEGYAYVISMDVEKLFDTVSQRVKSARISKRSKRVLENGKSIKLRHN